MLATLLVTCKDAYAASVTADTMVAQCDLCDIAKTPGYKRLNYLTNITGFTAHWLFLFDCCAELLLHTDQPTTTEQALCYISPEHFEAQGEDESMQAFFARLQVAYGKALSAMRRLKRRAEMPHPNTLVRLILRKTQRKYTLKVRVNSSGPLWTCRRLTSSSLWWSSCTARPLSAGTARTPTSTRRSRKATQSVGALRSRRRPTPQTQARRLAVAATAAIVAKGPQQMGRRHHSSRSLDSHDKTSSQSRLMRNSNA